MARPITPTPRLNVKESEAFRERLVRDLRKPLTLVPTPKLKEALEFLSRDANLKDR